MSLADRFGAALARASGAGDRTRPVESAHQEPTFRPVPPSAIAVAVADVLDLDGAGIALTDPLMRLPLGASGPAVIRAEQLQTTLGEGPCLDAAGKATVEVFDAHTLEARWPVYHGGLLDQTGFRAVAAVPLLYPGGAFAAVNLYSTRPDFPTLPAADELVDGIGLPVTALLLGLIKDLGELDLWDGDRIRRVMGDDVAAANLARRLDVWTGVGMVMEAAHVDDRDALSLLRSCSFSRGLTVDVVSRALVHGQLSTGAVIAAAD